MLAVILTVLLFFMMGFNSAFLFSNKTCKENTHRVPDLENMIKEQEFYQWVLVAYYPLSMKEGSHSITDVSVELRIINKPTKISIYRYGDCLFKDHPISIVNNGEINIILVDGKEYMGIEYYKHDNFGDFNFTLMESELILYSVLKFTNSTMFALYNCTQVDITTSRESLMILEIKDLCMPPTDEKIVKNELLNHGIQLDDLIFVHGKTITCNFYNDEFKAYYTKQQKFNLLSENKSCLYFINFKLSFITSIALVIVFA